jgi:DNA-binding NarL/FixJ family response regulator
VETVSIVLADDHDILLDGIATLINDHPGMKVVGKASSAEAALQLVERLQPSVLITDISMGAHSGLWLTQTVRERFPLIRVIVLSMHDSVPHISAMLEAGADGYLLKNVKQDELLSAIEKVMTGARYLQRSIAGSYTRSLQQQKEAEKQCRLSPREIEIMRLVVQGISTAGISRRLFISELTVETHRKNIGRKTGAKNPLSLTRFAQESGLL